jgi:hypothetical protein
MTKCIVHLLNGDSDTHDAPEPYMDVVVKDGVLSIVISRYQGPVLKRIEYPLTSIRNWEYER